MIFWLQLKSPILKQITTSPVMGYVIYRSFLGGGGSTYPIEITLLHYLRSKTFMIFWQKVIAWFVLWQLFWMQRVQRNMQQGKQNLETPLPKGKSWNVKLFYKILKMVHLLNFLGGGNYAMAYEMWWCDKEDSPENKSWVSQNHFDTFLNFPKLVWLLVRIEITDQLMGWELDSWLTLSYWNNNKKNLIIKAQGESDFREF